MKNFLKAAIITGSAFSGNLLINVIRSKLVALLLGPGGVAVLAQLGGFTALIITITSLGLAAAIVRFIAEYKAEHRYRDLKVLIVSTTLYMAVVSTVVTLGLLVLLPHVSQFIFGKQIFLILIALSLLNIPISVVTNLAVSLLQGLKEIKLDAAFSIFATAVTAVLLVVFLVPFGTTGAVVGMLIANYITSVIFFVFVLRSLNKHLESQISFWRAPKWRAYFQPSALRPLTGIAVASLVGGGITNLADIMIRSNLIHHFGLAVAGSVQPALTFSSQYTGLLSGAIGTYAIPRLSELSRRTGLFQKEYNDYVRLMLLVVTPFAILVSCFARYLVPLLYSSKFDAAIPLISLQAVADVLEFSFIAIAGAFLPMGRGKILLFLGAGVPLLYYGAYLELLPAYGLKAIPIASGVSWLIAAGCSYIILRRTLSLQIRRKNFWIMANSAVATIVVAYAVSRLPLLAGSSLAVATLCGWAAINITRGEWQLALQLAKQRLSAS